MNAALMERPSQGTLVPDDEATNLIAVIARAVRDPEVDVSKMERLMAMYERVEAKNAERAFNDAMNAAQSEMRPISADAQNKQTNSAYATFGKLDKVLRPIYLKHGFSLSFDEGDSPKPEHVRVICYVSHKDGHTRTYHRDMPADGKGAKGGDVMTKTHAAGAAGSYGARYLLKGIFNVAIGEDDNDGNTNENPDNAIANPIYDKIDLAQSVDELKKVKPEIEKAQVQSCTRRNLIGAYNAKHKKLKGEPA